MLPLDGSFPATLPQNSDFHTMDRTWPDTTCCDDKVYIEELNERTARLLPTPSQSCFLCGMPLGVAQQPSARSDLLPIGN